MDHNLGLKWSSYGLFTFTDFLLICDFQLIERNRTAIEQQSRGIESNQISIERTRLYITFFTLNLSYFVLDLKVHHSNQLRLSFCHGLPTLQTQNLTIYIYIYIASNINHEKALRKF